VYASHLISAGRLSDAEGVLRRQVEKNPNGVAAHVALANFLQRAGRGAEADRLASEWEARQPAPSGFLLAAGDHWLRRGDVPRAQAAYRRGLALGGEGKPAFFARLCDLELVRRDPEAALRAAQEGLKEFPSDFELRRKLSLMLLVSTDAKKREEARAGLVALLAEKPKEVALRLRLAASLEAEGKNAEAMEQLRQAVNQQPGSVEAQVALGSALLRGGQPALALERAEASLLLVPNLVAGLDLKTGALSDLRRYSELRVTLNEMRRITPDSPILAREFGWLALREGKLADAERELRRARSEDPADGRTLLGLVRVLVAQKRMPAALEEISRARAKEPARPDYRLLEGEVLLAMGKTKESRALFAGLVGDFPRFAEPRVQLSHIAWSEGDTGLSLKLLAEAKSLDGGDPGILRVYGNRLDALGRFTESVAVYRDAMKLEPANPIVWNNLAYALAASGQSLDEAEQLARKSVGVIQGQPGVLDTLGFVLLQRGQTAEAVKLFSGLAARHGANPVYRYHYGLALKKSGDAAAARRQFTQALALSPAPALERELQQALAPAAS
jgi:Flp pilus assembly protein TadD